MIMSSEKFQKVMDNFEVLIKCFRKCQQFFIGTFSMKKCSKSRKNWGMSRAVEHLKLFIAISPPFTPLHSKVSVCASQSKMQIVIHYRHIKPNLGVTW